MSCRDSPGSLGRTATFKHCCSPLIKLACSIMLRQTVLLKLWVEGRRAAAEHRRASDAPSQCHSSGGESCQVSSGIKKLTVITQCSYCERILPVLAAESVFLLSLLQELLKNLCSDFECISDGGFQLQRWGHVDTVQRDKIPCSIHDVCVLHASFNFFGFSHHLTTDLDNNVNINMSAFETQALM